MAEDLPPLENLSPLTWACHICHQDRPDNKISVYKTDIGIEQGFPPETMEQNVRYCNDNPDCTERAKSFKFLGTTKDGENPYGS